MGLGLAGGGRASRVRIAVDVLEEVLVHEPLRVQVLELEVGELGTQPIPQVVLCSLGDLTQVTQGPAGLGGDLGQFVRPEDDKRDHREDQQLGEGQVEHRSALRPTGEHTHVHSKRCRAHAGQWDGLTHDATRTRPRDIRFQNPVGPSCGSAPTTASTVWGGASATIVNTKPWPAQASERWSGRAKTTWPPALVFRQPGSVAGSLPRCSNTDTMDRPSE